MRVLSFAAGIAAVLIGTSVSQADFWHVANHGLFAASFKDVVIDPVDPNVLILSGGGGIYRTVDGGANWTSSSTGLPAGTGVSDLAMDPSNHLNIYGAAGASVVKSGDGGLTWTPYSTGIVHPYISGVTVAPSTNNVVFAGTIIGGRNGGMFKSTDYGVTWTQVAGSDIAGSGLGNDAAPVRVDPYNASLLYCATTYYVNFYKSTDGGYHWGVTDNEYPIKAIAVDPVESNRIYAGGSGGLKISLDYGDTWTPTTVSGSVVAIESAPSNRDIVYALTFDNGVWKSTDRGLSWGQPGTRMAQFEGLAVHPTNPQVIYATTTGEGVLKSTNGGGSFTAVNKGLPLTITGGFVETQPGTGDVFIIIRGQGLYRSTNEGSSWEQVAPIPQFVADFRIHPNSPSTMYLGCDDGYRSTDSGVTWEPLSVEPSEPRVSSLTASPASTSLLWASAGALVKRSLNAGGVWTTMFTCPAHPEWGNNSKYIADIEVDPTTSNRIYLATGNHPWRSDDNGATWTMLDTLTYQVYYGDPPVLKNMSYTRDITIDPTSPNIVYCTTQWGGVWKSTNYGDTWARLPMPHDVLLVTNNVVLDPRDHNVVYISSIGGYEGAGRGVFRSPDGGDTWELLDSGLAGYDLYVYWAALSQENPDRVFAVTYENGFYRSSAPVSWWPFQPGWNLFGLPVIPDDNDPAVIFADLQPPNEIDGVLYRYRPGVGYEAYNAAEPEAFGPMQLGEGYWLHVETDQPPLTFWGCPPAGPATVSLATPGWRLIGHTWEEPVLVSEFTVSRLGGEPAPFADAIGPWLDGVLWGYWPDLGGYVTAGLEGPPVRYSAACAPSWGYWIYAATDGLSLTIPPP